MAPSKQISTSEALMAEAADLADRGRWEAAREIWEEVTDLHLKQPEAATALLRLAETEADLFQALQHLEQIFLHHPGSPEEETAAALQGEIFYLLGEYRSTADAYAFYLSHFPRGEVAGVAQDRLITSLIEIGRPDEALMEWDRAAERNPARLRDVGALMQRADALIAQENWQAAADWLLEIIARFPNRDQIPRAHLAAGLCLETLSRWEEALDLYEALIRQWPNSVEAQLASERFEALKGLQRMARMVIH